MIKSSIRVFSKKELDQFNYGLYSYNVIGEPDLYLNKFSIEQLGGVNKVYKTSVDNIINRVIHPEDQEMGIRSVKLVAEHPSQLFIHFRRFLIREKEFQWMFVTCIVTFLTRMYTSRSLTVFFYTNMYFPCAFQQMHVFLVPPSSPFSFIFMR